MNRISYKNLYPLTDKAIVDDMGNNLRTLRLNANLSQQQLADTAGLDRITISKMENGRPITMLTLVQVLRALEKLDLLLPFYFEPEISPLQVAEQEDKLRKRATGKVNKTHKPHSEW
jgi:transcriptional regulator with XRE-family HTH domain